MVVVAIAGQPGCGSTTAGKMLAARLEIKFFSVGDYTKKIALGVSQAEETRRAKEFWGSKKGKSASFNYESDMMQKDLAAKGKIVIDAKLAVHMLRGFADVSVWLKAPLEKRAERVAKRGKIDKKEAEAILKEKEKLERENWLRIYGFDYFEQEKEADMVIDVSRKKPEEIVGAIIKEIKRRKLA